jgi:Heparinase II/III-like protein
LLTWGIRISELNGERFSDVVYDRARKSVQFLRTCMVDENGWLPNYGANDGALFFKLSSGHYRDYRPQLLALAAAVGLSFDAGDSYEDAQWYGLSTTAKEKWRPALGAHKFSLGGYYIIREPDTLTFIRCGNHKDRPSHADNLHLDIWYQGENILIDAGSYKYNITSSENTVNDIRAASLAMCDYGELSNEDFANHYWPRAMEAMVKQMNASEMLRYFSGTRSHNTVMLDNKDQMLKGGRFIWYYWSQCISAELKDEEMVFVFSGAVSAFRYIRRGIVHKRTVVKHKGQPMWEVKDEIINAPEGMITRQMWHYKTESRNRIVIEAMNATGEELTPQVKEGWYSSLYGQKEQTEECYFFELDRKIETVIEIAHDK